MKVCLKLAAGSETNSGIFPEATIVNPKQDDICDEVYRSQ